MKVSHCCVCADARRRSNGELGYSSAKHTACSSKTAGGQSASLRRWRAASFDCNAGSRSSTSCNARISSPSDDRASSHHRVFARLTRDRVNQKTSAPPFVWRRSAAVSRLCSSAYRTARGCNAAKVASAESTPQSEVYSSLIQSNTSSRGAPPSQEPAPGADVVIGLLARDATDDPVGEAATEFAGDVSASGTSIRVNAGWTDAGPSSRRAGARRRRLPRPPPSTGRAGVAVVAPTKPTKAESNGRGRTFLVRTGAVVAASKLSAARTDETHQSAHEGTGIEQHHEDAHMYEPACKDARASEVIAKRPHKLHDMAAGAHEDCSVEQSAIDQSEPPQTLTHLPHPFCLTKW